MDEEGKYGIKREKAGSQPDSLVDIVAETTKTPDRREREDGLARAIRYCVDLLNHQLPEIGFETMKTICQTVLAQPPFIENPFTTMTFDSGDLPLLRLLLKTFHKEEHGVADDYDMDICYALDGSKWFYSGWAGDDSLHWECREFADDEIDKALSKLMAALLVLNQVFPKTAPRIAQESKSLREFFRTSTATRNCAEQDASAGG